MATGRNPIDALLRDEIAMGTIIVTVGVFLLLVFIFNVYIPFKSERDRIKIEMSDAIDDEEYLYWKRELREFYINQIPIVGFIIRLIINR